MIGLLLEVEEKLPEEMGEQLRHSFGGDTELKCELKQTRVRF